MVEIRAAVARAFSASLRLFRLDDLLVGFKASVSDARRTLQ
jgi:hypothetical protein